MNLQKLYPKKIRGWGFAVGFISAFIIIIVALVVVTTKTEKNHAGRTYNATLNLCSFKDNKYKLPKSKKRIWNKLPMKYARVSFQQLSTEPFRKLPKIQADFPVRSTAFLEKQNDRRGKIKGTFKTVWHKYLDLAGWHDELRPLTGDADDSFGGWGVTVFDNLDTLWIMGLTRSFAWVVDAALSIDNNDLKTLMTDNLNMYETNIRFLGGLISAYEVSGCQNPAIMDKAVELGDLIYHAFDTPSGSPINQWDPRKALAGEEQILPQNQSLTVLGSYAMEFTRLSQITGEMKWYDAAQRISKALEDQQHRTQVPGLWPRGYQTDPLDLTKDTSFTLGSEADSAYEYMLKMIAVLGDIGVAANYRKMYEYFSETLIKELIFRPMLPKNNDILLVGKRYTNGSGLFDPEMEHLACFAGSMFSLAGRIMENETHVDIGRKLTDGCVWAYNSTPTYIMPEAMTVFPCPSLQPCEWNETAWRQSTTSTDLPLGIIEVDNPKYLLRPEAIESVFYMYRLTGDAKYQDIAWNMYKSITRHTLAPYGFAELGDVMQVPAPQQNAMQSYFLAGTLKYLYLIFSPPERISLDEYVFNTEGHPFRIPR